ncbi:glycosyltransferase [Rubritalea sp.]|uniref:glycosyltransferase n=1 Tax=Rubritalea sp. TaxID=2109375 RepID=UPI003EF9BA52
MSLRKKIEHSIRHFRSYILPSHRRSASQTKLLAQPIPTDKPLCLIDFASIKIDNVTGRYLYHLVTEFEALGFSIAYTNRFRFLATMQVKACKKLLLNHPFSILELGEPPQNCSIILTDVTQLYSSASAKVISVVYDQVRASQQCAHSFELPFFVHPEINESQQVAEFIKQQSPNLKQRPMSIIFAGNAKSPKYDAPVLAEKYQVLSRVKALQIAEEFLGSRRVRRPLDLQELAPHPEQRRTLTIATTQDLKIPSEQWIETLALADFYFACPGVEMPLCHNLIEALAAGAIPILQYPQYLSPPLINGIHCLTYHDETSLTQAIDTALAMPTEEVASMRAAAQQYYLEHLQPGNFAQLLIDEPSTKAIIHLNAYRVPRN